LLQPEPAFRHVRRRDGYLALEDMGLIGDGTTAALVGLGGSIRCSAFRASTRSPLFCGLLEAGRGGSFTIAPDS
jgi:alpha,alpha-trehalase